MKWTKLGQILHTDFYAQCPTPLVLDDRLRVYYAHRDSKNKSEIRYADFRLDDPTQMIEKPDQRCLENGKPGCFDDEGQIPSFAMRSGNHVNLYYSGWNTRNTVPYHNAMGCAISYDLGKNFERAYDGPIMDRTAREPYLAVTPCITTDGTMYYVSGTSWKKFDGKYEPIYVICKATSANGWDWQRNGSPVIQPEYPEECFSRPWVLKGKKDTHLWFSYRGSRDYRDGVGAYRIGYAKSIDDGQTWERLDHEITEDFEPNSPDDWDGKMQAYPAVFSANDKLYLLYNGSTFGKHGFGLAVAK